MLVFLQTAAPSSFKGEKKTLPVTSPLARPESMFQGKLCACHSFIGLIDLLFGKVKHLLWAGPSAEC